MPKHLVLVAGVLLLARAGTPPRTSLPEVSFIHDYFLVHTYIDTTPTRQALIKLKNIAEKAKDMNKSNDKGNEGEEESIFRTEDMTTFENMNIIATHLLDELAQLEGLSVRDGRGIDLIGDLIHEIAGTPSGRQHQELVEKVNAIMESQKQEITGAIRVTERIEAVPHGLKEQNDHLLEITDILKVHEKRLQAIERNELLIFNVLEFFSTAEKVIHLSEVNIRRINIINSDGKENFLSVHAISTKELLNIIQNAAFRADSLDPVFKMNIGEYYTHKLARTSWQNAKIHTSLKIPLINTKEKYKLEPITQEERESSKLDITDFAARAVNEESGGFSYLSTDDLKECNILNTQLFLCQRRKIEMRSDKVIVYEITPTHIMICLDEDTEKEATRRCEGEESSIMLKHTQILKVAHQCSVIHNLFFISKLSFHAASEIPHPDTEIEVILKQKARKKKEQTAQKIDTMHKAIESYGMRIEDMEKQVSSLKVSEESLLTKLGIQEKIINYAGGALSSGGLILFIIIFIMFFMLRKSVARLK